jgi:hypothetical protein
MKTNHLYQSKTLTIPQLFIIIMITLVARTLSNLFLRIDTSLVIIPRSMFANGFMMQASWLDIAVPLSLVILFIKRSDFVSSLKQINSSFLLQVLKFMMFPLLVSLTFYALVEKWSLKPELSMISATRFLQWILAYVAVNLLFDRLPTFKKWIKLIIILLILFLFGYSQDLIVQNLNSLGQFGILSIIAPTGLILCSVIVAFRKMFKINRGNAILVASMIGAAVCFLIPAMQSDNIFTLFLPVLSVIIVGIAIYRSKIFYWSSLSLFIFISVALNFMMIYVAEKKGLDNGNNQNSTRVKTGSVEVYYEDKKVKEVAIQMGKVLDAANKISMQEFGISPDVKKLTINGIAPGGFYADFNQSITGNLISEEYIKNVMDPGYLDVKQTSANFPDPVNSILHEYSHLYGVIGYLPWMMNEEEGWATYAATGLACRLFETYGDSLWQPAYNYKAYSDSITQYNIQNHSVLWSHSTEFGSFQLWKSIGDSMGEVRLFQKRWQLTDHEFERQLVLHSNTDRAITLIKSIGKNYFITASQLHPIQFSEVNSLADWRAQRKVLNMSEEQIDRMYELRKNQIINPAISLPEKYPTIPDLSLFIISIGIALFIRLKSGSKSNLKSHLSKGNNQ